MSRAEISPNAQAIDQPSLDRHFGGGTDVLPLWIAEPYLPNSTAVIEALQSRASQGWFGYETRPEALVEAFWQWMSTRHGWAPNDLETLISPSVGTSIGALIAKQTSPGDGVILQPPVFTDFKPLVASAGRTVVRNALINDGVGYKMDTDDLDQKAAETETKALILCNPHNPVGRVWTAEELSAVAEICGRNDIFVIADEIHADLVLPPHRFTPFAEAAAGTNVRWAALHGPIKTFGLAGVCDTLVVTAGQDVAESFEAQSSQLHLTRNNVFGLAAFEAAYAGSGEWVDDLLDTVARNAALLRDGLPSEIEVVELQGTYLAWLDFRALGLDAIELASWLAESAQIALSPGHWFGREGAGYARMTIAAPYDRIEQAVSRLATAVSLR